MAQSDGRTESNEGSGTAEPITLNDPDGSVTRVAPWSTWTREQIRTPGGEPALVTHLEGGQLWFAAGRPRSPWRHETRVGPAVVSTPRGRFHVTAEPDGGATIVCLAGRTRIAAGLREPVLLGPDQTAAVSSDGATLVVMDRSADDSEPHDDFGASQDLLGAVGPAPVEPVGTVDPVIDPVSSVSVPGATEERTGPVAGESHDRPPKAKKAKREKQPKAPRPAKPVKALRGSDLEEIVEVASLPPRRGRMIAEVVAVAALAAVLVSAIVVFSRDDPSAPNDVAIKPVATTSTAAQRTTSTGSATTSPPSSAPVTAPPATAPPATAPPVTAAITSDPSATARFTMTGCRRAGQGVVASVEIAQRTGGPARFKVEVALIDQSGSIVAGNSTDSPVLSAGSSGTVEVSIANPTGTPGSCEFIGGSVA